MKASELELRQRPDANGKIYLGVANTLISEIAAGIYVVGSLLPTEHELSSRFGASRSTIRLALAQLKDRGYISRRKAVGSQVRSANPLAAYSQSVETFEDLISVAVREVRSIRQVVKVKFDRATARKFSAPLGSEWVRFSGPRIDVKTGTPVSWTDIYVDVAFECISEKVRNNPQILVSTILETESGRAILEVVQAVQGVLIDKVLAHELTAIDGQAGLEIIRQYKSEAGKILQLSKTTYPAERVVVSSHLKRAKG